MIAHVGAGVRVSVDTNLCLKIYVRLVSEVFFGQVNFVWSALLEPSVSFSGVPSRTESACVCVCLCVGDICRSMCFPLSSPSSSNVNTLGNVGLPVLSTVTHRIGIRSFEFFVPVYNHSHVVLMVRDMYSVYLYNYVDGLWADCMMCASIPACAPLMRGKRPFLVQMMNPCFWTTDSMTPPSSGRWTLIKRSSLPVRTPICER